MATDFTWTYRADGQVAAATAPNGNATDLGYDALGRLTGSDTDTTPGAGGTDRAVYAWSYNRAGQTLTEDSTITGDASNGQVSYAYDPLGRLTGSTLAGVTTAYGWDADVNRTSVQVGAGTAATTAYDAADRPTSGTNPTTTYTSDPDGRLTVAPGYRYEWDHLGRLTKVLPPSGNNALATYSYDPLDRLRLVDHGGNDRTRFRYVGLTTNVAQWLDDAAGTVTRSVANGWRGERLADWTGTSSNLRFYGTNAHHDVTWLAGSTGTVSQALRYDPWGNPRPSSVPSGYSPLRFQGSWFDEATNLSWVVTRWYAPALGRFISEDTLLGEPIDPPSRHLYAYGQGEPMGRWDPDGRAALGTCGGYGCSAGSGASSRIEQLRAFFKRFPGYQCGYHCYGYIPKTGTGFGAPILDFMDWERSRINGSKWWSVVNKEIVQGALTAWRRFELNVHYVKPPSSDSSYLWYKYIKGKYLTAGSLAWWKPGYHGGNRTQMWAAHQRALWNGVRKAASYYSSESSEERLVIYKVLVNVEWYARTWPDLDAGLGSAIRLASYPGYNPDKNIPTRSQACSMWYPRTLTLSFFSIYLNLDPYFYTGDKPALQKKLCG